VRKEVKELLFMAYWELNPDKDIKEVAKLAADLTRAGKFPIKGTKMIGWYNTPTIPSWGVTIWEADSEEAVFNGLLVWTKAMPGIFSCFKVSPALSAEKAIPLAL
jgi:hypothetical protein